MSAATRPGDLGPLEGLTGSGRFNPQRERMDLRLATSQKPAGFKFATGLVAGVIRRKLTDGQWVRMEMYCPGKEGNKGRHGDHNGSCVDAVLWIAS